MREIKYIDFEFDEKLYDNSPIYITSEKFWDGGITTDSSLEEKAEFYDIARRMACAIKKS